MSTGLFRLVVHAGRLLLNTELRYKEKHSNYHDRESGKVVISESLRNMLPYEFNSDDLKNK
jgi:hypothetical protein